MKTISDLMSEAQALMREHPDAAMKLLADARGFHACVPDAYDIMLGCAAREAGKPEIALAHLRTVLAENHPSPALRRFCAELLLELGQIAQAGEQLALSVAAGAPLEKLSLEMKFVLDDYLRRHMPESQNIKALDLQIAAQFGVLDERNRVLFIYTPKVACTVLKATVVMNSSKRESYLAYGKPIHEFVGRDWDKDKIMGAIVAPDVFRFAVLRDPATRILSAYLNKFVTNPPAEAAGLLQNKQRAVQAGQALAGVSFDPARGISFEEFVRFLSEADDAEMDPHWLPQSRIIGTDLNLYDHVGRFESLAATFALLERRFGYVPEQDSSVHLGGQKSHATNYGQLKPIDEPHRALPAALRRLGSVYPVADAFLTPELRTILVKRFADDAEMHTAISR